MRMVSSPAVSELAADVPGLCMMFAYKTVVPYCPACVVAKHAKLMSAEAM